MIVEQHATDHNLVRLKQDWLAIPPLVNVPRHVRVADELVDAVAQALGIDFPIEGSNEALRRPDLAGQLWAEVPEVTRRRYSAVMQQLEESGVAEAWPKGLVEAALAVLKHGMLRLSELPQQPMSGMVQRSN